ncbi:NUDIX family protein [Burkholderiales bacterium JOSHI_001]|nr:NUDIX family protein [Burkholderiales bacterium JOSHI_001]
MAAPHWRAVERARAFDASARVPFAVLDRARGRAIPVGSVARAHLPALAAFSDLLAQDAKAGVQLTVPSTERDAAFAHMNQRLREAGLIVAWRDETYPVIAPASGELLATFERAASRFWGTLTFGAHANGYVAGPDGRPERLWVARRSWTKPTDPGALDNLVGGGVPHSQTPLEAVQREAWEEAGLTSAHLHGLRPGRVLLVQRDIPEGLQVEELHVFDLPLPADVQPRNQDGEVAELMCLPMDEALAATNEMTVDAALATLDLALRHGLLPADQAVALAARCAPLWRPA